LLLVVQYYLEAFVVCKQLNKAGLRKFDGNSPKIVALRVAPVLDIQNKNLWFIS